MSGFGERFRKAGYKIPKPLIKVDGKPIIQYIVEMFPGENDFIFICNKDHLNCVAFQMQYTLKKIAPKSSIIEINPHKLGPVYAVLSAIDHINLNQPTIVNYADFTCDWKFEDFCKMVEEKKCDGAIPCYRGFHPHTLWNNYYAYVKENNMRAFDIQEKTPFTDFPRQEFASSGTYYFRSGKLMKDYFEKCVDKDLKVAGEYYVSMAYKPMMEDNLNIQVYELNHFMQWGTPSDLEDYCYWSNTFSSMQDETKPPKHEGALLLPMAGLGNRFMIENYALPKPLIEVSGKPMAVQALIDLPKTDKQKFILRKNMKGSRKLKEALIKHASSAEFVELKDITDGQASSCLIGASGLDLNQPVTIAACDNGMIYSSNSFQSLIDSEGVDIIVWGARGYPGAIRFPEMYGWINADKKGLIKNVSVKKPLANPEKDPIIVGTFTFKKLDYFLKSTEHMKARNAMINGEYYVDTVINDAIALNLNCVLFEIESYICWGTPNDLKTFKYWQSCFNEWDNHPYTMELDEN